MGATTANELHEVPSVTNSEKASAAGIRSKWIARGIAVILLIGVAGTVFWLDSRHFESTDDAQVDGHSAALSTRIEGTVVWVNPNAENDHSVKVRSGSEDSVPRRSRGLHRSCD
jgi:membrane fusion protein (multidrug efflux system)